MTVVPVRTIVVVLAAASLAGCIDARSQYAPYAGYSPPPPNAPARPQYPVTQPAAAAPQAKAAAAPAANPDAIPNRAVDSQALPPVSGAAGPRASRSSPYGRSLLLTSLVWRPGDEGAERIDVARHHRLRPEQTEPTGKPAKSAKAERTGRRGRRHHARGELQPAAKPEHTVVVHPGDTIDSIADRLGTSPEEIMKANHVRHPRDLDVGHKLKVPTAKAYVVKHGDTLYSISRRFDVPVDALKDLNGLGSGAKLHPGQRIDLPSKPGEAPAETAPTPAPARRGRTLPPAASYRPAPPTRPSSVAGSAFGGPSAAPEAVTPAPTAPAAPAPTAPAAPAAGPEHPIPYSAMPGHAAPPAYAPPSVARPAAQPPIELPAGPSDAEVAAAGRGRFVWPVQGKLLSGFGPLPGGQHSDGVDIAAADGAPVLAAASGDVVYAGNLVPGFGNLVLIKHEDGWVTAYAHLGRTEVKIRDHVSQGAEIGTVGASGDVSQPQLHFEVRYAPSPRERARPIDPALVLPAGQ